MGDAAGDDLGGGEPIEPLPLELYVRAATQWAARCLGLEREVGTIEKGRLADLVVVDGDPLDDITVLLDPARLELVYKGGAICADRRPSPRPG